MSALTSSRSLDALDGLAGPAPAAPRAPLLPRYRRPLTFGAVLDETFRIFRRAWRPLMLTLACGAVPYGVVSALWAFALSRTFSQAPEIMNAAAATEDFGPFIAWLGSIAGGGLLVVIAFTLFMTPVTAAVVVLADGALRGHTIRVAPALARGLRLTPRLLLLVLLGLLLETLVFLLCLPLLFLWAMPGLFGLVPLIGCLVWWGNPAARRPWLCWLVVLTTPFGLSMYVTYRWILSLPAVVLEGRRPVAALRRSQTLTHGRWFRVFGVVAVIGVISSLIQAVPGVIVAVLSGAVSAGIVFTQPDTAAVPQNPQAFLSTFETVTNLASGAADAVGAMLVGALPPIALTLLFQDLRNRQEGADLIERLDATGPSGAPDVAAATASPAAPVAPPAANPAL